MDRQDETLQGNEKIEAAIQGLQKEATQEQLAHTATVIRRRMKDSGQVIVAVEPSIGTTQMNLKMIQTFRRCKLVVCCLQVLMKK